MTIPKVTPVDAVPVRSAAVSAAAYRTSVEGFLGDLPPLSAQINATVTAINATVAEIDGDAVAATEAAAIALATYNAMVAANLGGFTGASASAVAIGTGVKNFTLPAGKLWAKDQAIQIYSSASPGNYMVGRVISYNRTTGALSVYVFTAEGAGSFSNWQVVPMGPRAAPAVNSVTSTKTDTATTTSTAWVDSGIEVTIGLEDPSSRVRLDAMIQANSSGSTAYVAFRITRNDVPVAQGDAAGSRIRALMVLAGQVAVNGTSSLCGAALDTPGSVGPHTYKVQWLVNTGTGYLNRGPTDTDSTNAFRTASALTATEVRQA